MHKNQEYTVIPLAIQHNNNDYPVLINLSIEASIDKASDPNAEVVLALKKHDQLIQVLIDGRAYRAIYDQTARGHILFQDRRIDPKTLTKMIRKHIK